MAILVCRIGGYILRTRCKSIGDFSIFVENMGLDVTENVMEQDIETNMCKYECIMNKDCKSFASNEDEMKCLFYKTSSHDPVDDAKLIEMQGWTYYTTLYNITEVG